METPKPPQIRRIYCLKLNRCPPLPNPTPSFVVGFRTNRSISQSQNPRQNCLEFRTWIRFFFQGLSSIRHNSYVSINTSLDKTRRRKKKKRKEMLVFPEGVQSRAALDVPAALRSPPVPGPSRFAPCRCATPGAGRSSVIHCLFGRERGGGRGRASSN